MWQQIIAASSLWAIRCQQRDEDHSRSTPAAGLSRRTSVVRLSTFLVLFFVCISHQIAGELFSFLTYRSVPTECLVVDAFPIERRHAAATYFVSTKNSRTRVLLSMNKSPSPEDYSFENWQGSSSRKILSSADDFQTFLNQCCIQSFTFLLKSLRDPHTIKWMENFTQPLKLANSKSSTVLQDPDIGAAPSYDSRFDHLQTSGDTLLSYHGLGLLNTTKFPSWDSYFSQLLEQPVEVYTIVAGTRSANNFIPEYELEIKPASLSARLLSVREQIAQEFVRDLNVIATMGGNTLQSYWEAILQHQNRLDDNIPIQRQTLIFLEFNPGEDEGNAPSPLRKGNFDLLCLLTLQEAIHRVLAELESSEEEPHFYDFLKQFYLTRYRSHFYGVQPYGRADDFLEELLLSSPSIRVDDDENLAIVDPMRITEIILEARSRVALEWRKEAQFVPEMHASIKRLQLNLLMGIVPPQNSEKTTESTNQDSIFE